MQPPLVATNPNDERGFLGLAFHPGFNNPASPGYQTLYTYNSEMIPTNTLPTYPVSKQRHEHLPERPQRVEDLQHERQCR